MKTVSAMAMVMFGSVEGTTFIWETPNSTASYGIKSTGTRSIKFLKNTQTKIVIAQGAMRSFVG